MDAETAGEGMDYSTFNTGGNPLGGLGASDPSMPKVWLTCFAVDSTDAAVATVEAKGGKVTMPAMDTPFGRFAIVEGHELLEVEQIVERSDRYVVVEKSAGAEAELVEQTDPRRPLDS